MSEDPKPKYSRAKLRKMAKIVIAAGLKSDPRFFKFHLAMAVSTGVGGAALDQEIARLASDEDLGDVQAE